MSSKSSTAWGLVGIMILMIIFGSVLLGIGYDFIYGHAQ
jgi:hypothetical protein